MLKKIFCTASVFKFKCRLIKMKRNHKCRSAVAPAMFPEPSSCMWSVAVHWTAQVCISCTKCGPWISSISITQQLIRYAYFGAPPQTYWIRICILTGSLVTEKLWYTQMHTHTFPNHQLKHMAYEYMTLIHHAYDVYVCVYVVYIISIVFNEMSWSRERTQQGKGSEDGHVCV